MGAGRPGPLPQTMNLHVWWHKLRGGLWYRPLLWIGGIGLLALLLLEVDRRLIYGPLMVTTPWLFVDSADAARTLLGAVATATLTVATLAFSILMLAVVQTVNAYSPRVLHEYLDDAGNQHVLGLLLGTFLYALLVLRRIEDTGERPFLPMVSVSVAVLLSLLAVIVFIYFINHVAHSIEVSSIIKRIRLEAEAVVPERFPVDTGRPWTQETPPSLPPEGWQTLSVRAAHAGYLDEVDGEMLLAQLVAAGGILRLERQIGDYVLEGAPLATLWLPPGGGESVVAEMEETFDLGLNEERTVLQDLDYALQQLKDVALRALSPAINDPRTAVNCINVMTHILSELAREPAINPYRCDDQGQLRLVARPQDFATALDVAFLQLHSYVLNDAAVTGQFFDLYADLAAHVRRPADREKVWEHLERLAFEAGQAIASPWERARYNGSLRRAAAALGRTPAEE